MMTITFLGNASQDSSGLRWAPLDSKPRQVALRVQNGSMESLEAHGAMSSTINNNTPETSRERGRSLKGVFGLPSLIGPAAHAEAPPRLLTSI